MVQVKIEILSIETDSSHQMITITANLTIHGVTQEVHVSEMVGNLRDMTDADVRQHFKGIFADVSRQKIGEFQEITNGTWNRASHFLGEIHTIEVDLDEEPIPTIDNLPFTLFLRDSTNLTDIWKIIIDGGVIKKFLSSVEEAFEL